MLCRLFILLSALSFGLVIVVWVQGPLDFKWQGAHWQLHADQKRLSLDNEPQRRAERAHLLQQEQAAYIAGYAKRVQRSNAVTAATKRLQRLYGQSDRSLDAAELNLSMTSWAEWGRDYDIAVAASEKHDPLMAVPSVAKRPAVIQSPTSLVQLTAPFWLCIATTAVLPLGWLSLAMGRYCQRRRHKLELIRCGRTCFRCGYDLRASPDRCPECGAVPASRTQAL